MTVASAVPDMAERLAAADLAITSAGRTVFEVATLGTPAIVLAQNERELTHTFASEDHGFRHLGLGRDVPTTTIAAEVMRLVDDPAAAGRCNQDAPGGPATAGPRGSSA